VFPNGQGVHVSPFPGNRTTEIILQDRSATGVNLSGSKTYYFWSGSWRQVGQGLVNKNDDVLSPEACFFVRQNVSGDTTLTLCGSVSMSKLALHLLTNPAMKQDNSMALARPVSVSLIQSSLFQSGSFSASPHPGNRTDELLTFDNTVRGINKSASAVYYYWNGGWRRVGAGSVDVGNDAVFLPGTGVIIRKNPQTVPTVWINSPNY
jgi:uncharacterized protein (TIGR02597 family)